MKVAIAVKDEEANSNVFDFHTRKRLTKKQVARLAKGAHLAEAGRVVGHYSQLGYERFVVFGINGDKWDVLEVNADDCRPAVAFALAGYLADVVTNESMVDSDDDSDDSG